MYKYTTALFFAATFLSVPGLAEEAPTLPQRLKTTWREDAQSVGGEVYKFSIPKQSERFFIIVREKLTEDGDWNQLMSHEFEQKNDHYTYDVLLSFTCGKTDKEGYPAKDDGKMNLSIEFRHGEPYRLRDIVDSRDSDDLYRPSRRYRVAIARPLKKITDWPCDVHCVDVGTELPWDSKQPLCLLQMTPRDAAGAENGEFVPVAEICFVYK